MKQIACPLILITFSFACKKKSDVFVPHRFCEDGFIRWGGEPAADGFGWYYTKSLDVLSHYPIKDLPDDFKTDSLAVSICLEKTRELFLCECLQPYNFYKINSIRRR